MKKFLKNYKSTIILLLAVVIGAIAGIIFKDKALIVKPLGDLFLNLLLVVIVPLIFFTITASISKMKQPKRLSKILFSILGMFIITSIVAVLVGFISTSVVNLVKPEDTNKIKEVFTDTSVETNDLNLLERTVNTISVNDFPLLLSKSNMIALIVISILFGIAVNMAGVKGKKVSEL
ncbi:MAG: cation:dicarboxylase symporter family transporter, partial [Bacilli bacterium]